MTPSARPARVGGAKRRDRPGGRPGGRHRDRARAVRVAQPRQHRARGVARAACPKRSGQWDYVHANSVALDAAGDFIVSARHTSTVLQDLARDRPDRVAPRRPALGLPHGPGHALLEPARRAPAARRDADAVRQQRAAAAARRRSRAITLRARHRAHDRHAAQRASRTRAGCSRPPRAASSACRAATRSSAGARGATSRSTTRAGGSCSTATSRSATTPTAPTGSRGPARPAARPSSIATRRGERVIAARELERRDRRRALGAVGGLARGRADAGQGRPVRRLRDRRSRRSPANATSRMRALDAAGAVLGTSAAIRTGESAH